MYKKYKMNNKLQILKKKKKHLRGFDTLHVFNLMYWYPLCFISLKLYVLITYN